jgi:trans-2,3-dihydro-3-hydroxyanthranilate isomerase
MGRPSLIEVEADRMDGKISAVRVGGASVMVADGEIAV